MLDQNTDRMWFVIGAVIVGAAIIFIANGTIPEIFASVTDTFKQSSDMATSEIDWRMANRINAYDYTEHYFLNEGTGSIRPDDGGEYYATSGFFKVEGGVDYIFTAPKETANKRIVYYDSDKNRIEGYLAPSYRSKELRTTAPDNAEYARVSTSFTKYINNSELYSPVDTWWFGDAEYDPGFFK